MGRHLANLLMRRIHSQTIPHWKQSMVLALILVLAACSAPASPPKPLADLHLPGITQIPGITTLHVPPDRGVIETLTTYQPAGAASSPRVLFTLDGQVYDVGQDGSGLRSLNMRCSGQISTTSDGRWVACQSGADVVLTSLIASPLDTAQTIIANERGDSAWLPDNQHLAVVSRTNGQCAISIYTASPTYDHFQLSALMTFAQFSVPNGCSIFGLAWSPDGSWLAFVALGGPSRVYALSMVSILPEILRSRSLLMIAVSSNMVEAIGTTTVLTPPSWSRHKNGLALTFSGPDWSHITQVDIATRQQSVLLSVPEGRVDSVSWTPDGEHLVFAHGKPQCVECGSSFTPSHLYVYTPPA